MSYNHPTYMIVGQLDLLSLFHFNFIQYVVVINNCTFLTFTHTQLIQIVQNSLMN